MKLSTRGRYGLKLMLDLAIHYGEQYIPLKEIAKRQELSEKYLEQLMLKLNRAKLVRSARGLNGGYRLIKAPEEISVGEVLHAVEGSLAPVDCLEGGTAGCAHLDTCATIGLYRRIKDAVDNVVDHTTLQDLVNDYQEKIKRK